MSYAMLACEFSAAFKDWLIERYGSEVLTLHEYYPDIPEFHFYAPVEEAGAVRAEDYALFLSETKKK